MVAVALAAPPTAADLAAQGVVIAVVSQGLVAPRVDLVAPAGLRPAVQAALAWRIDAMRAQLAARRAGAPARTLVAIPGVSTPLAPPVTWRGQVTDYGRTYWQERSAQRPEAGWCPSCGEPGGDAGDCALCNAARVAALRAEGLLPLPVAATAPTWAIGGRWQDAAAGLPEIVVAPRVPWVCSCGAENFGRRREVEGCGACTNRADATVDCSRLGGGR